MNLTKWLWYTIIIGLAPYFLRCTVVSLLYDSKFEMILNPYDLIIFGFIVGISNINEIELLDKNIISRSWITTTNAISILTISFSCILFTISVLNEIRPDLVRPMTLFVFVCVVDCALLIYTISFYLYLKVCLYVSKS